MTIAELFERYLRHAEATGHFCAESLEQRKTRFEAFAAHCGERPIEELRAYHLADWIEGQPSLASTSTRKAVANQINAALNWAVRGGRIASNPFRGVNYPESEPRPPMPDEVLEKIDLLASGPFRAAVRFLRLTGCRLGDLCGLTWADVDLVEGVAIVHRHKSRKKTGKPRVIVLVEEAVELLRQLQDGRANGQEFVFVNARGRPWTRRTLGQTLARLKRRYGLRTPATLHGIRHQFGTAAVKNGAPLKLISLQLGHASTAITERYYLHLEKEIEAIRTAARAALPTRKNGN